MPDGNYTILWEGEGDIAVIGKNGPCEGISEISSAPNKMVVNINWAKMPDDNILQLRILKSVKGNHVRNIRFLLPGFDETNYSESQPFNPRLLHKLQPFTTIRFMDWMGTNNSDAKKWSERRPETFYTMGQYKLPGGGKMGGVALEYIVKLLNVTGKDGWVNIPHLADEEYIRNMATYFLNNLNKTSKIYLEWSNEVWNGSFSQNWYAWNVKDSQFPEAKGDYKKTVALFEKRVFDIWADVWGTQKNRLVRVVSGRAVQFDFARDKCEFLGPDNWDAISCTGYFGNFESNPQGANNSSTLDDLFKALQDNVDGVYNRGAPNWNEHGAYAKQKGKRFVQYECGHHLTTKGATGHIYDLFTQAHFDPRMYNLYQYAMDKCEKAGSDLFMAFVLASDQAGRYGGWGHLQDLSVEPSKKTAPKYTALLDHANYTLEPYSEFRVGIHAGSMERKSFVPLRYRTNGPARFFSLDGRLLGSPRRHGMVLKYTGKTAEKSIRLHQ